MTDKEYTDWFKSHVCPICNAKAICTKQSDVETCLIYKMRKQEKEVEE